MRRLYPSRAPLHLRVTPGAWPAFDPTPILSRLHLLLPAGRALRPFRHLPLRAHLVALSLGTLFPVVLFCGALVFQLAHQARSSAEGRLLWGARTTSAALDRMFEASIHALQALAQSERLDVPEPDEFFREAFRMEEAQPTWIAVTLQEPDGQVLVDARRGSPERAPSPDDRESLLAVLRTEHPAVGDLVRGPGIAPAFQVRVPVRRQGTVRYVLSALISAEAVARLEGTGARALPAWTWMVVDGRGVVVERTRDPDAFVGRPAGSSFLKALRAAQEGVFRSSALQGIPSYVGFCRSGLSNWSVAVMVEQALLDAPARNMSLGVAVLGLLALAIAGLGAFLLSGRLSSRIVAAAAAAEDLAAGHRPELPPSSVDEMDRLAGALTRSADLLAERERERDQSLSRAETARAEAERQSRAKDEFLAMLGHELRNPLSPIRSATELLRRRGQGEARELAVIERQVQQLVHLVDDLLEVGRITRGRIALRLEPVPLAQAVAGALETTGPMLEARRHYIEVDVPTDLVVRADPLRLAQVVGNLLSNAARYTPPGGHLAVRAYAQDEQAVLEVADDGQGIAADLLPRVFDPFVQGPRSSDRTEGGLGLGLTLVRRLVELHGGTVAAKSPGPGQGTTFTVVLPRAEGAPLQRPAPLPHRAGPSRRILVVDDNADSAELMAEVFRQAGHEVAFAHDGFSALRTVEGFAPEIALLDVGLPGMDGYELARRITQRMGEGAPSYVSVTGYGQPSDRDRSRAAGFVRHVVKPADPQALLALVDEVTLERDAQA